MSERPHCELPGACRAKGPRHCRTCHMRQVGGDAARKAAWADPEVRARMSAARKAAWADPEVRARMSAAQRRAKAKTAVKLAGLPMMRRTVDRARELLDAGEPIEVVADALQQEARESAAGRRAGSPRLPEAAE